MNTNSQCVILIILLIFACHSKEQRYVEENKDTIISEKPETISNREKNDYVENTDLSSSVETEIVPTLENKNSRKKNNIYSACLLLSWEQIRHELKDSIVVNSENSVDFQLVNKSNSYIGVLNSNEYKRDLKIAGGISVHSYFNQMLPFIAPLDKLEEGMMFNNKLVSAFGLKKYDLDKIKAITIYFYKNDDNFVIGLNSLNSSHEILLAKGLSLTGSLGSTFKELQTRIDLGEKEFRENRWKYLFLRQDILVIPEILFNIETNYEKLVNQHFVTSKGDAHYIDEAYQKISFSMNNDGISVQDNVLMRVDSAMGSFDSKPKHLVFDKPFFIALKKRSSNNPYFAMVVRNTEIMIKK